MPKKYQKMNTLQTTIEQAWENRALLQEKTTTEVDEEDLKIKLQETQMVKEQLIWLTNLSANIVKTSKSLMQS